MTIKKDKKTKYSHNNMKLTDQECDAFRRLPLDFNDMVRAIHKAGYEQACKEKRDSKYKQKDLTGLESGASTRVKKRSSILRLAAWVCSIFLLRRK